MTEVKPHQIWADNDRRNDGRTIRVDAIENGKAVCTVLTNSTKAQKELDRGTAGFQDTRGRVTRISLSRFRPTSTGYRLVSEGEATDG